MEKLKIHILFKSLTLVLVLTLLTPTFVKFNHVFEHHHREICHGENQAHLHTSDVDCEFYKFQLNQLFTIPFYRAEIPLVEDNHLLISSLYQSLGAFQQPHFSLRGPPVSI